MSQENVEIVRRVIDAYNRRDVAAILAVCDEDVSCFSVVAPVEGPYRGHDGLRQYFEGVVGGWERMLIEEPDFRDAGAYVVVLYRLSMRGRGSGVELAQDGGSTFEFRDGRIVEWRSYLTGQEALKAAGLRE